MSKMNLPNRLTVLRLCLVPVFIAVLLVSDALWANLVGLAVFCVASLTDMLDGKIARKYNLITDFGKFLDPLADKFMVIAALLVVLYKACNRADGDKSKLFVIVIFIATFVVIMRELAVTSMRLVVSTTSGTVIAANMLGKIKTCTQIACVIVSLFEPVVYLNIDSLHFLAEWMPASTVLAVLMTVFTLWSGINYLASYWKFLDPSK